MLSPPTGTVEGLLTHARDDHPPRGSEMTRPATENTRAMSGMPRPFLTSLCAEGFDRMSTAAADELMRVRKGLYRRGRRSHFGIVPTTGEEILAAVAPGRSFGPASYLAANLLHLTTQVPHGRFTPSADGRAHRFRLVPIGQC